MREGAYLTAVRDDHVLQELRFYGDLRRHVELDPFEQFPSVLLCSLHSIREAEVVLRFGFIVLNGVLFLG